MSMLYNWQGNLANTGLAATLSGGGGAGVDGAEVRALISRINVLGTMLDTVEEYRRRQNPREFDEIVAAGRAAFDTWTDETSAWASALYASHVSSDRAARAAEWRQYFAQVGRVADATAATVDGVTYHLAFEDVCAIPVTLAPDGSGGLALPAHEVSVSTAERELLTGATPALRVAARDAGAVGNQVHVAVTNGRATVARVVGVPAAFGALGGIGALDLTVNGTLRTYLAAGTESSGGAYANAINAQIGAYVRASLTSAGLLVIESRASGSGASVVVGGTGDATLLAQLGLTALQRGDGGYLFNLAVTRGAAGGGYERIETYADLDASATDYAAQLAAIARASLLLVALTPLAALRPDNLTSALLTGGAGGGRAALETRLARAAKLPEVARDPEFAGLLKTYTDQYETAWLNPPAFRFNSHLASVPVGSPGSASRLPRAEYTIGTAVADLVSLVRLAAVRAEVRRFTR